ncbi:hypothetical protein [Enterococcus sp. BWR-S5]|uniref:hypothetical protein n=1 Tax=Enterococcus sp. BWR-S5 TaxID=2787714 RepID=UPI001922C180|nr:hypothetical protein [Enterococcus sp. BWR-S5]MBL1225992.1 hypothetical protein [Enterococcus sp. BWR-S5]
MKRIMISLSFLLLLSGCASPAATESDEPSASSTVSSSTTQQDPNVTIDYNRQQQLFMMTNDTKELVTIIVSETEFFKQEGDSWVADTGGSKGMISMTFNLLPGETTKHEENVPFDSGRIKGVFHFSIGEEHYTKEVIFEK